MIFSIQPRSVIVYCQFNNFVGMKAENIERKFWKLRYIRWGYHLIFPRSRKKEMEYNGYIMIISTIGSTIYLIKVENPLFSFKIVLREANIYLFIKYTKKKSNTFITMPRCTRNKQNSQKQGFNL